MYELLLLVFSIIVSLVGLVLYVITHDQLYLLLCLPGCVALVLLVFCVYLLLEFVIRRISRRSKVQQDIPRTTKNKLYYVDKSLIDYAKKYQQLKEDEEV